MREKAQMSQSIAARKSGKTRNTIVAYERGDREATLTQFDDLLSVYGYEIRLNIG
jgi:DNA-binding XRE family transcriptional regulator